jgi:hypothetical protein
MHRTFMTLAMVSLLPPAVFRWQVAMTHPAVIPAVVLTFVAVLIAHDWRSGPPRAASLWGGLALMLSLPLRLVVAQTTAWHAVASWLVQHTASG